MLPDPGKSSDLLREKHTTDLVPITATKLPPLTTFAVIFSAKFPAFSLENCPDVYVDKNIFLMQYEDKLMKFSFDFARWNQG